MITYWEKRIGKINEEIYKDADKYVRDLRKLYEQEINNIDEKIYNHLSKLQEEAGGISLFDAKKLLNDKELDLFKMGLEGFIKKSQGNITPEIERELNIISRRVRISRLQAMEVEIKKTVAGLMSREEKGLFAHLGRTYERRYYKELYELQRITGYDSVRKISKEDLKIILNNPWTSDGREFSERIWERGDKLVNSLKDSLIRNIARGASPEESIKEIQKQFGVSKAAASRLVYTETAAISSKATQDSYKRIGVKKYEILATLDLKTSDICRSQDGKTYDIKDYRVGITAPPFHPNCRTDTIPFFDDNLERQLDKNVGRSARNPKTDKTEIVENINYENWYKKYVMGEKTSKSGYNKNNRTGQTNKVNKDKKELPKTLERFKEHQEKWENNVIRQELSENEIESVSKGIKKLVDSNEYAIRVDSSVLEKILDDGRFKNQFETNTSGGALNAEYRKKATKQLFGVGNKKLSASEREKYDYLGHKNFAEDRRDFSVGQYGNCVVHFDKNKLAGKVTYTIDDSLGFAINNMTVAGDAGNPSACGIRNDRLKDIANLFVNSKNSPNLSDFVEDTSIRYVELQYHGELNADDIKEVCFIEDEGAFVDDRVIKKLKDKGIKVFKMSGDWYEETTVEI
ncbi:DUF3626 domain-containing protein [Peptoniphilus sp. AGMB00490]|uniref:DUF3626 domain-containing protein n=1 Tax=Peptoniphilus faecalis TaxID=2731255 RepID=A0A848RFQ8_9FIRM|nr:minor capsid protein [Peptoniphilus faecalis]NMW84233.1 DUF3626 domain-containing protein [Peptoniphilus faecalis]